MDIKHKIIDLCRHFNNIMGLMAKMNILPAKLYKPFSEKKKQ